MIDRDLYRYLENLTAFCETIADVFLDIEIEDEAKIEIHEALDLVHQALAALDPNRHEVAIDFDLDDQA